MEMIERSLKQWAGTCYRMSRVALLLFFLVLAMGRLEAQVCNGMPTAGTVSAGSSTACPGTVVVLTLAGESTNGTTLQWQSSTDNATWKNINSATSDTYAYTTPGSLTTTWFRVAVTCTQSVQTAYTASASVGLMHMAQYAASLPFTEDFEGSWIHICTDGQYPQPKAAGFVWENLPATGNNSWRRDDNGASANWDGDGVGVYSPGGAGGSGNSARYHSTYGTTGNLDLYINALTAMASKKLSFDYINTDGKDSLEILISTDGGATFTRLYGVYTTVGWQHKATLFFSTSATVILRFHAVADNGDSDMGIDNVKVEEVAPCSGTPTIGAATTSNSHPCNGELFTLALSSVAPSVEGITYQWQSSADGTTGWSDIAQATDSTFTNATTATTYYRIVVTCIASGSVSTSNAVQVVAAVPMQGSYTINSAQATGGGNFHSFNDAYTALRCAGVSGAVLFNVQTGSGPYHEQLIAEAIPGASATNTITFNGNGNTIYFSSHDQNSAAVVKLRGASNFIFNNLHIDARRTDTQTPVWGFGLQLLKSADNNVFTNCRIITDTLDPTNGNYYGVMISGDETGPNSGLPASCNNNLFDRDTIIGGYYGISLQSSSNGICGGNKFTNNLVTGFSFKGLVLYGAASTTVEGNIFSCPTRKNTSSFIGIELTGQCISTLISKNRFTNPYDGHPTGGYLNYFGIVAYNYGDFNSTGTQIVNNLLYDLGMAEGINVMMIATDALIYHNTIDINFSGPQFSTLCGIKMLGGSESAQLRNNLVTITNNSLSSGYAVFAYANSVNADYDDYYLSGSGTNYIGHLSSDAATLAAWQTATGGEANSYSVNPVYWAPATGDYKPTVSAIDNVGTPLGVTTDIVNVERSTLKPDVGAFEFDACQPMHGIYTIDAKAAPGTSRTFLSFNDAYNALHCGIDGPVVFNVQQGSGVYNEQLNMQAILGSSDVHTVTFNGHGETIHYSSADANYHAVIRFDGTKHVILDSLVIDALPPDGEAINRWGVGVQLYNEADSNRIHGCTILTDSIRADYLFDSRRQEAYNGIMFRTNNPTDRVFASYNMIDSNNISGGYSSINMEGTGKGISVLNNNITGFYEFGILMEGVWPGALYLDSLVIEGNRVWNSNTCLCGIRLSRCDNLRVNKNMAFHLKSDYTDVIYVSGNNSTEESRTVISNNLIYDIGLDAGDTRSAYVYDGIMLVSPGVTDVLHNTVIMPHVNDWVGSAVSGIHNAYVLEEGEDMKVNIKDNLVQVTGNGQGAGVCIQLYQWSPADTVHYFLDNNNYVLDSSERNHIGLLMATDFSSITYPNTLKDWQLATKMDSNSVSIDPMFADSVNGDFHPTNYLMDDLGVPLSITTDIENAARSTVHPDLGAYEFKGCPKYFASFKLPVGKYCLGDTLVFVAKDTVLGRQTIASWAWDFGNGTAATGQTGVGLFKDAGTYNVQLAVKTDLDCAADTTQSIVVVDCEKSIFIPNAFTPNGDGLNDELRVYGSGIHSISLMIFNQWGEKVFESKDLATGWDGRQNGKLQPTGVYMYVCKIVMSDGSEMLKKGAVNLIR